MIMKTIKEWTTNLKENIIKKLYSHFDYFYFKVNAKTSINYVHN